MIELAPTPVAPEEGATIESHIDLVAVGGGFVLPNDDLAVRVAYFGDFPIPGALELVDPGLLAEGFETAFQGAAGTVLSFVGPLVEGAVESAILTTGIPREEAPLYDGWPVSNRNRLNDLLVEDDRFVRWYRAP